MASNSSKNHALPPGRRRVECTHPKCGKYGHFTSQCWVAHPKLRPRGKANVDKCGTGRGWDAPSDKSNEVANENPSWLDDWTEMSDALAPRSSSCAHGLSPLFKFPQEIQAKIYEHVYEEKHGVRVRMSLQAASRWESCYYDGTMGGSEVVVRGYDYGGLALVCKKVRKDSQHAREQAFNGRMRIVWDEDNYGLAFTKICGPGWEHLRNRVTELAISGLTGRTTGDLFDTVWGMIPTHFPRVTEINIQYNIYRYRLADADNPYLLTSDWLRINDESYPEEFDAGRRDSDFTNPTGVLNVRNLVHSMEQASRPCTIFLKITKNWLKHRQCCDFQQSIKFLVMADRLEAVERVFGRSL
ncbi:uncharacterized protein PV07_11884 [Cladophialophora immunda]|uniref:Uncharacterized protein n=1 Tax=Cladophialophora immunda TaxID=569365 RepID=A0A0D2BZF2_9EURO|nr:uncharacterized protein PV07_11884 [Cladophialophora immunda]KIW23705.1 hypothetical protein PV07_11884 [Cladophialophora immunda]OQV03373.1 hypothetical protein CLAIMM_08423 [Cladophialophora immunda]